MRIASRKPKSLSLCLSLSLPLNVARVSTFFPILVSTLPLLSHFLSTHSPFLLFFFHGTLV